ncbi:MAG TPA: hypothetical protein VLE70_16025 [Anaerolineae bacterium]|nr:hypothetical protein [Anaerolineae bacterium]
MARRKARRRRSNSEKVMIVLGILIALSMLFSLFVGLGGGGSDSLGNSPLPESERFEVPAEPVGALDVGLSPLAMIGPSTAGPPLA